MEEFLASVFVAILEVIMAAILVAVWQLSGRLSSMGLCHRRCHTPYVPYLSKVTLLLNFPSQTWWKLRGFPHPTTQTSVCTSGHSYPKACGDGARDIRVLICGAKTIFVPVLLLIDKLANFLLIFSWHSFLYNPLRNTTSNGLIALWEWQAQKDKSNATWGKCNSGRKYSSRCTTWTGSQHNVNAITRMISILTMFLFWNSLLRIRSGERTPGTLCLHSFRQINAYSVAMNSNGIK